MANLSDLLERVCKGPSQLGDVGEGGALVAFALHCLMIGDGFAPKQSSGPVSKHLENDWNTKYDSEWIFEYSRKGHKSIFILHCSLQASSGKMFVQGRDSESPTNIHNLGLQVGKYVPHPSRCCSPTWKGVFAQEEVLSDMLREYISQPLIRNAASPQKAKPIFDWCRQMWTSRLLAGDSLLPSGTEKAWIMPSCIAMGSIAVAVVGIYWLKQGRLQRQK